MFQNEIQIQSIQKVPTFGSNLDDWAAADVLTDFKRPWNPTAPLPRTEFRILHSSSTLAFRFDIEDSELVLAAADTPEERVLGSDRAEVFFSTNPKLDRYYGLEIDPRGNLLDYSAQHYRQIEWTWTMRGLELDTEITETGYRVEGRLSISELDMLDVIQEDRTIVGGVFRANFSQLADGSIEQDWMPWIDPKTETPDFHVPEAFGRFRLMD